MEGCENPILGQPERHEGLNRPSIFISYGRKDDPEFVRQLHDHLESLGLDVWFDKADMESRGRPFLEEIYEPIVKKADKILLILGPHAKKSENVRVEWEKAREYGKVIIPVVLNGDFSFLPDDIPILSKLDAIDCNENRSREDIFDEIARKVSREEVPPAEPIGLPQLPKYHVKRFDKISTLEQSLFADLLGSKHIPSQDRITAIVGTSGVGKTSLANEFAHDSFTRRFFSDGIFWLKRTKAGNEYEQDDLKQDIDLLLRQIYDDFSLETQSLEHGLSELRKILAKKRCLLVVDDVWKEDQIVPLIDIIQGSESHVLFTTRLADLAAGVGANVLPEITGMTDDQSKKLLLSWAHHQTDQPEPSEMNDILRHCSNIPLALAMVGGMVNGHPERWPDILKRLDSFKLDEIDFKLRHYHHESLLKAIQVSLEFLPPDEEHEFYKDWYKDLAVFPKNAVISEAALIALWVNRAKKGNVEQLRAEIHNFLKVIQDRCLATSNEDWIFLLDIQKDFVYSFINEEKRMELNNKIVDGYQQLYPNDLILCPDDGFFYRNIIPTMVNANRLQEARDLLIRKEWIEKKHKLGLQLPMISEYLSVAEKLKENDEGSWKLLVSIGRSLMKPLLHYPKDTNAFLNDFSYELSQFGHISGVVKLLSDIKVVPRGLLERDNDLFWTIHTTHGDSIESFAFSKRNPEGTWFAVTKKALYYLRNKKINSFENAFVRILDLADAKDEILGSVLNSFNNAYLLIRDRENNVCHLEHYDDTGELLKLGSFELNKLLDMEVAFDRFVLIAHDETIRVIDLETSKQSDKSGSFDQPIKSAALNFPHAAIISEDGFVCRWKYGDEKITVFRPEQEFIDKAGLWDPDKVSISNDGNLIVFGCNKRTIGLWYMGNNGFSVSELLAKVNSDIQFLSLYETFHGRYVSLVTEDGGIHIFDLSTYREIWSRNLNKKITAVHFGNDEEHGSLKPDLWVAFDDGSLKTWDIFTKIRQEWNKNGSYQKIESLKEKVTESDKE